MNTVNTNTKTVGPSNPADAKQILLKDISAKWGKFSEQELEAFKSKDDLVTQVAAKYSIDKARAQRNVDGLMNGREI